MNVKLKPSSSPIMLLTGACSIRTWRVIKLPYYSPRRRDQHLVPAICYCSLSSSSIVVTNSNEKKYTRKKSSAKEKVIVISGPTGSGKSRLAMELAKRVNGEIISADSVQVYQGLDVGSAKPSVSDRKEVPHHLVDIMHPCEEYSVGKFFEDGREATKDILSRGRVPIVTGGTGLYLRWFVYGKPDVPKVTPEISAEVDSELMGLERIGDWDTAVELVVKAGDKKAQSLPANDWYRLRRRLEIIKSSGLPPSAFRVPYDSYKDVSDSRLSDRFHDSNSSANEHQDNDKLEESNSSDLDYDFNCFFLSSQRLDLYRSIDFRCEDMLSGSDGILREAQWLLDIDLLPNTNSATRAIGYRQAMDYLLMCRDNGGQSSPGDFLAFLSNFQQASRNFAKRQLTWFRNENIYHWLDASRPLEDVLNFIHDAYRYHDDNKPLEVPDSLKMSKAMSNYREVNELKKYRAKNRHFVTREDCSEILSWILQTQP